MSRRGSRETPTPPWSAHSTDTEQRSSAPVMPMWSRRSSRSSTPPVGERRFSARRPAKHRWKSLMRKIPASWKTGNKGIENRERLPSITGSPKAKRRFRSMFEPTRREAKDVVMDVRSFSPLHKPRTGKRTQSPKKHVEFADPTLVSIQSSSVSFPFTVPSFHTYRNSGVFSPYKQANPMRRWTPLHLPARMEKQLGESKEALGRISLLKWKDIRDAKLASERGDLAEREDLPNKLSISRELRKVIEDDYTSIAHRMIRLHIYRDDGQVEPLYTKHLEQLDEGIDKEERVVQWISAVNQIEPSAMVPVIRTESNYSIHQ